MDTDTLAQVLTETLYNGGYRVIGSRGDTFMMTWRETFESAMDAAAPYLTAAIQDPKGRVIVSWGVE